MTSAIDDERTIDKKLPEFDSTLSDPLKATTLCRIVRSNIAAVSSVHSGSPVAIVCRFHVQRMNKIAINSAAKSANSRLPRSSH
ncbi:hypothetical protein OPU71_14120 [Niveibacterium sp. 24ML]|uniref:hypothetical protein n=1 Tax=Niveibacterium sp. 24ML TaxID=2985512 RepID=UPI002270E740|nr:hypothetical protein [Niveibacterium sp. 24ML]MCX9157264.1 hypothetical protein [Niveibacterium sp. 24ML]